MTAVVDSDLDGVMFDEDCVTVEGEEVVSAKMIQDFRRVEPFDADSSNHAQRKCMSDTGRIDS